MAWFTVAAVGVGFVLQNPYAFLAGFISITYLGLEAVRFRRFITAVTDRLDVKVAPTHLSGFVADNFRLDVVIANSYKLPVRIIGSRPRVASQLRVEAGEKKEYLLPSGSEFHTGVYVRPLSPGHFGITQWVVVLEDRSRLFTHNLSLGCTATVEVAPVVGRVEAKLQLGSLANLTRFGTGADLARIREVVSQDDFHSIDWKGTARTGKFMKKEYFSETEPGVLVAVDASVLNRWGQVIVQLGKLFVTFLSSTPVGLIMFDDRRVIKQLPPSTGTHSRVLILRSLLTGSSTVHWDESTLNERRLHQDLVEFIRLLQSTARNPPSRRVDVLAQSLLPYYENNLVNYSSEVKQQGAFQALETVSNTSPMLIIVVANHNRDARGLCEGAILANASGHRIIVAVIASAREGLPPEILGLKELGIEVLQSGGADLANVIRQAIVAIPTMRVRNPRQLQHSRVS